VEQLERIIPIAKQVLILQVDDEQRDLWLWERAERVARLTQLVGRMPEVADQSVDHLALAVAGLFHCAGWATQFQQGTVDRWHVLTRPTSDIQRELGAALVQEHVAAQLPPKTLRLACEAIRQCNDRSTDLLEAQLLAEAENLDEVGVVYVLRQFRQYQSEGRPLTQLFASWERQKEYRYWEVRVNDGFRFETTQRLARRRLEAVEHFMQALARDTGGLDLAQTLVEAGNPVPEDLLRPLTPSVEWTS
jgi:hypothetical protein